MNYRMVHIPNEGWKVYNLVSTIQNWIKAAKVFELTNKTKVTKLTIEKLRLQYIEAIVLSVLICSSICVF